MNENVLQKITEIYDEYRDTVKPLIAEVESSYEVFPLPILNEVRALHDHLSRCFQSGQSESDILYQIDRAKSHNTRMIFDCYKFLNVYYSDKIAKFEKQTRYIDLTLIDSGTFYITYLELSKKAVTSVREAKKLENKDTDTAFLAYQEAYNTYVELFDFISAHLTKVNWARARFIGERVLMVAGWIVSVIITSILTNNNQKIVTVIKSVYDKL